MREFNNLVEKATEPKTPGEFIKHCREHYGLTQTKLAERMGKKQSSISIYENDQRLPDVVGLTDLMLALQWSGDSLREFLLLARDFYKGEQPHGD